jgi:hypothetical protein
VTIIRRGRGPARGAAERRLGAGVGIIIITGQSRQGSRPRRRWLPAA